MNNLKNEGEKVMYVQKVVADTNCLNTGEFIAFLFTMLNTRYDFRFDFKIPILFTVDILKNHGIDISEKGKNLAGILMNGENPN